MAKQSQQQLGWATPSSPRLLGLLRPRILIILGCTLTILLSACLLVLQFENQNYALRLQLFRPSHYFEKSCYQPLESGTDRVQQLKEQQQSGNGKDEEDGEWQFTPSRDANNYALNSEQCLAAFPKLYSEIDKSVEQRKEANNPITFKEIDSRKKLGQGMARAMIHQGEVSRAYNTNTAYV